MNLKRTSLLVLFAVGTAATLSACATLQRGPVGNPAVPQPAKAVDLNRYAGLWYEIGRYENGFERGCEAVTAEYGLRDDGLVSVLNTCRQGAVDGPVKTAQGRAKVTPGSDNAKLKVSFFGPFYGGYNVIKLDDKYQYALVSGPNRDYLWILSRTPTIPDAVKQDYLNTARGLGFRVDQLVWVKH